MAGIILYLVAIGYALTRPAQRPASPDRDVLDTTSARDPARATAARGHEHGQKIQRGGMLLGILIVVIVFLMVVKPGH